MLAPILLPLSAVFADLVAHAPLTARDRLEARLSLASRYTLEVASLCRPLEEGFVLTLVGSTAEFEVLRSDFSPACEPMRTRLEARAQKPLDAYVIHYAHLPTSLRGTGIGLAMYRTAAAEAGRRGGVLGPDRCMDSGMGSTSGMAKDTWRRLALDPTLWTEARPEGFPLVVFDPNPRPRT